MIATAKQQEPRVLGPGTPNANLMHEKRRVDLGLESLQCRLVAVREQNSHDFPLGTLPIGGFAVHREHKRDLVFSLNRSVSPGSRERMYGLYRGAWSQLYMT